MPGKVTVYKKIARSLVDQCIDRRTDIRKCIAAFFKDPRVISELRGMLLMCVGVSADFLLHSTKTRL